MSCFLCCTRVAMLDSAMVSSKESLEAYARKPDCFRRAASRIQSKCAELETNEGARVKGKTGIAHCLDMIL